MNSNSLILEVNSVRFCYRRNSFELNIENLEIPNGGIVGLIGPNGAGKTTLIQILSGRLLPSQGSVKIKGLSPSQAVEKGLSACLLESDPPFSRVPLYFWKKVAEGLRPAIEKPNSKEDPMDSVINEKATSPFCRMSFGEQRLAALGLVLRGTAQMVLLDEPTKGLDPKQRENVWNKIVGERERGTTVIISSHLLGDLEEYADEVILLRSGMIVGKAKISEMKQTKGYFIFFHGMSNLDLLKEFGDVKHEVLEGSKRILIFFLKDGNRLDQILKIMAENGARVEKIEREGMGLEKFFQNCNFVD